VRYQQALLEAPRPLGPGASLGRTTEDRRGSIGAIGAIGAVGAIGAIGAVGAS